MSADRQFIAHVVDLLAPLGPVTARRFFGGTGLVLDGGQFAMVMGETLYLKTDGQNRPRFVAAGSRPFSYRTRKGEVTVEAYFALPGEVLDDEDELLSWARDAVAAARRGGK